MNIRCGLILDNLETELNCCKMNVQCRLFFKGNKPTSKLSKRVFLSVSVYTGILCMGGGTGVIVGVIVGTPSPIPKLLPGATEIVDVAVGYLGFLDSLMCLDQ